MHLEENELRDLAMFFARRFPTASLRGPLLTAARVEEPGIDDPTAVWLVILAEAQGSGRLRKLVAAARRTAPDDDNLQDVCHILQPPPSRLGSTLAVASGIACALLVVAIAAPALQSPSEAADATGSAPAALVSAISPTPAPDAVVAANITPPRTNLEIVSKVRVSSDANPPAPEKPAATAAPARPDPAPAATSRGRCRAGKDELVGYWYAGKDAPGSAGETIVAANTTNVRADYPDEHNSFNARAPVRCLLLEGDQLTLTADPIAVPGDRYWVPLYGGDIH